MPHRPGHPEDTGEGIYSMDRRKYLSTLAAGAAFGTVAAGLAACGGGTGSSSTEGTAEDSSAAHSHLMEATTLDDMKGKWGYLRVFPPEVTMVSEARTDMLVGKNTIRIPFFNNTGLDLSASPVLGFTLLTIGCPPKFALAINLTREDHPPSEQPPLADILKRHNAMDADLLAMGYRAEPWTGMEATPCPQP